MARRATRTVEEAVGACEPTTAAGTDRACVCVDAWSRVGGPRADTGLRVASGVSFGFERFERHTARHGDAASTIELGATSAQQHGRGAV